MVSGMYMGELIRQVLVDLMRDDLIFFNCNREKILERGAFYTRYFLRGTMGNFLK
jgi:hexokinase